MGAQVLHHGAHFGFGDCRVTARNHGGGLALGELQHLTVAQQIGYAQIGHPRLLGSKEFSRPAQFKIELRDFKSILRAHHGVKTLLGFE